MFMIHEIKEWMTDVANLCRRYDVEELHLFGSATSAVSIAEVGDLDFLARFKDAPPARHASNYFGLVEGLATMFDCRVDLVEHDAIRNPYFRTAVEEQKEPLYGVSDPKSAWCWMRPGNTDSCARAPAGFATS
jgi:uncharacterized protein